MGLSTHVLDTMHGTPAAGMTVALYTLQGGQATLVRRFELSADGRVPDGPLYRVPFHPSADGNSVEIGVEQAAFSQNASDFQTSLTFINMKLRGLAKAIDGQ